MAKLQVETLADRQHAAMEAIRAQRAQRLAQSDWVEAPDASISAAARAGWRVYRQLLRDWPARVADPLNPPPWPDDPAMVGTTDTYLIIAHGGYPDGGLVYGDPTLVTDWVARVRAAAQRRLQLNAAAALHVIRAELAEAQEAEALGVPPPGGRSSTQLQTLIQQGQTAFKSVYQAVQSATTIAGINAALEAARQQGLDWLVGPDWDPYPETCPWTVAT